jgi:hypothetical protein
MQQTFKKKHMKKIIVDNREKNLILQMHKSLMKEQTIGNISNDDELKFLQQAVTDGCLPSNGKLKRFKNTGRVFYSSESKQNPGKMIYFFADKTYKFADGSKSGKWKCKNLSPAESAANQKKSDTDAKIATYKQKGYKTLDELKAEKVDLTTLDKVYDTVDVAGTKLYVLKGKETQLTPNLSTPEFNSEQKSFIDYYTGKGYKLNPTRVEELSLAKITDKELNAPKDLFPNGLVLWYDPNKQKDIKRKDDSVLHDIITNQSVDRQACRKNINDYYTSYKRRNSLIADPATITNAKKIVQACKDQHYRNLGVLGIRDNRFKDILDELSDITDPNWKIK